MSNIFKKIGDWVTPQKKHCYLLNEGSWDDRQLLGTIFHSHLDVSWHSNISIHCKY